jgi:hypothetical protein
MENRELEELEIHQVIWDDSALELSIAALLGLVLRLDLSTTDEEYLFRECEMDCAYRLAELDLESARRNGRSTADIEVFEQVLALITRAHDLVGEERLDDAVALVRDAIDRKQLGEAAITGTD